MPTRVHLGGGAGKHWAADTPAEAGRALPLPEAQMPLTHRVPGQHKDGIRGQKHVSNDPGECRSLPTTLNTKQGAHDIHACAAVRVAIQTRTPRSHSAYSLRFREPSLPPHPKFSGPSRVRRPAVGRGRRRWRAGGARVRGCGRWRRRRPALRAARAAAGAEHGRTASVLQVAATLVDLEECCLECPSTLNQTF